PEHAGGARRVAAAVEVGERLTARHLLGVGHVDVGVVEREAELRADTQGARDVDRRDRRRRGDRDEGRPPPDHRPEVARRRTGRLSFAPWEAPVTDDSLARRIIDAAPSLMAYLDPAGHL